MALVSCGHTIRPQELTEITVMRPDCARGCVDVSATLHANGLVSYGNEYPMSGNIGKLQYLQLVQVLLADPAIQRGAVIAGRSGIPLSLLLIRYGCCSVRSIRFPTYPPLGPAESTDPARSLNVMSASIIATVDRTVHRPLLEHLRRWEELREVSYSSGSALCMRPPCGYSISLSAGGAAVLHRGGTFTARIPLRAVRGILQNHVLMLDAYYPPVGEDAGSASLTLQYADGWKYRVFAPDRNTWPVQLFEIDGAFAQLVADSNWQPIKFQTKGGVQRTSVGRGAVSRTRQPRRLRM